MIMIYYGNKIYKFKIQILNINYTFNKYIIILIYKFNKV